MKAKLEKIRDNLYAIIGLSNQYTILEVREATEAMATLDEVIKELDNDTVKTSWNNENSVY